MRPARPRDWLAALHRRRRWLIAIAVLALVRIVLPAVVRRVVVSQASTALHADVHVGDVDLGLLRGFVALEDVVVRAPDVPPGSPPLIRWTGVAVNLRWLALFRKAIVLEDVVLDTPHVSLERLADGTLNLMALLTASTSDDAGGSPPADASTGPGWAFGVDRITLRAGGVRFRDFMVTESEPLEIGLPTIEVTDIAIRPGLYGAPARARIEMRIDEGVLKINASASLRDDGISVETKITAQHLPLPRARVYIPKVGWSDLRGTMSMDVTHRLDTNGALHDLRGWFGLHDLLVHVPGFDDAALTWRALNAHVDPVDLVKQQVTVAQLDIDGLTLPIRTAGDQPLPLLHALRSESEPQSAPTPDASAAPEPATPWHWSLAAAQLTDATLLVLHNTGRTNLGVSAELHDLADEGDAPAAAKLNLAVGDGSLSVDGKLRLTPIGFGGHLVIDKLNVPDIVVASSAVPPEILPAARLALDLYAEAGSLASVPGDLDVRGTIALTGLRVAQPTQPTIDVDALEIGLDELHVTGLLAESQPSQGDVRVRSKLTVSNSRLAVPGASEPVVSVKTIGLVVEEVSAPALLTQAVPEGQNGIPSPIKVRAKLNVVEPRAVAANPKEFSATAQSIAVAFDEVLVPRSGNSNPGSWRVRLGEVRVAQPNVQVTRTQDGIVLPQLVAASASPSPEPTPEQSPAPSPPASPSVDVSIASFRLSNGRVAFTDRAVKPFYAGAIAPLDVTLKGLRYPELAADDVRVSAAIAPRGTIEATGNMGPSSGTVDLTIDTLALTPFNPYATAYSPYGIAGGSLTVGTKASFAPGGYRADSTIVLHQLDVSGAEGDALFQQNFGIPLTMALALLKDLSGNITLDVPLEADAEGMKVGVGTIVGGALRNALLGALASPLKLVGMVLPGSGEQAAAPPHVGFRAGRAEPAPEGEEQIKQLATFIASRPGMGVTLEPIPSTRDVRWLREQALLEELGKPQGILGAVRNLGQGGKRERIATALAARANDQASELSEDDARSLEEWLAERPAPSAAQLTVLADARLAFLERMLHDDFGVDATRVARSDQVAEPTDDAPVVQMRIGIVNK